MENQVTATGKDVIVIGGGDTGADCIGTAHRQGAWSVTSLEIMPQPGADRPANQPWPTYPMIYRVASAHEEGAATGSTRYPPRSSPMTPVGQWPARERGADGERGFEPVEGSERVLPAQLVLLAMGFPRTRAGRRRRPTRRRPDGRGNIVRDADYMTSVPGVFVAGDAGRGQSLIVWAIAEGRSAARGVDAYLMGSS